MTRSRFYLPSGTPRFAHVTLYETATIYLLVGSDARGELFRVLKITRPTDAEASSRDLKDIVEEDPRNYSSVEVGVLLGRLERAARAIGGIRRTIRAMTVFGFFRFLRGYHLVLVTATREIGTIDSHVVHAVAATEMIKLARVDPPRAGGRGWFSSFVAKKDPVLELEERYLSCFRAVELTKDFYFSFTYDVTHSLQSNVLHAAADAAAGVASQVDAPNSMYMWNHFGTRDMRALLRCRRWVVPITHGFFQQRTCETPFGTLARLTLLARRSRHYAGTRYLKRGISDAGHVANDVEVEQIVDDQDGHLSSFLQMRGSIPVCWSQEPNATVPRPPIEIKRGDHTFVRGRTHFADLFRRYGSPILVLNLVKTKDLGEKNKHPRRESKVGPLFEDCVNTTNATLPDELHIDYKEMDLSHLIKKEGRYNALFALKEHAARAIRKTGFFCTTPFRSPEKGMPPPLAPFAFGVTEEEEEEAGSEEEEEEVKGGGGGGSEGRRRAARARVVGKRRGGSSPSPTSWRSRPTDPNETMLQAGVIRVNCIDCLDRTNLAQRTAGHFVLQMQLSAMGLQPAEEDLKLQSLRAHHLDLVAVVSRPPEAKPVGRVLERMYEDLGDHISLQYAGSTAHRKVGTATEDYDAPVDAYMPVAAMGGEEGGGGGAPRGSQAPATPGGGPGGKRKGLSTVDKLGEVVTSVRRHISNTFTDTDKQHSLNLFLGIFEPRGGDELTLWEFWELHVHDHYLHNRAVASGAPVWFDGAMARRHIMYRTLLLPRRCVSRKIFQILNGARNFQPTSPMATIVRFLNAEECIALVHGVHRKQLEEAGPLTSASADALPVFDYDAQDPGSWWKMPRAEWTSNASSLARMRRFQWQQKMQQKQMLRSMAAEADAASFFKGGDGTSDGSAAAAEAAAAARAEAKAEAEADAERCRAEPFSMDLITHSSTFRVGGPLLRRFSLFEAPEGKRLTSFDAQLGMQAYKPTRFVSSRWTSAGNIRRQQSRTRSAQARKTSVVSRGIWAMRDGVSKAFTPIKSGQGSEQSVMRSSQQLDQRCVLFLSLSLSPLCITSNSDFILICFLPFPSPLVVPSQSERCVAAH